MRYLLLIFLVLIISLSGCNKQKQSHVNIKIIQTTDVHGTIFPYDFINNKETTNSLANIYTFVKQIRNQNPGRVVLLDNGDFLQGQPTVYYYNFEDTISPHIAAEVLNFMKYDAATVGNHDIETGHAVYDRFRREINMPYMAANVINTKTGKPYFTPYTVIERQGIKIAVLGLITPGIPNWLPENIWSNMKFTDMVETAKKWVKIIKEKENPDLLIGMFHAGIDYTYNNENKNTYLNENASKLVAEQVSGFDIILAGHDHKKYLEKIINPVGDTVILCDPRSHSKAFTFIDVDFYFDKNTGEYNKKIDAKIISTSTLPDEEFMNKFSNQYDVIKKYVSRQIGEFTKSMDSKYAYFESCSFMSFIHNVQLDATKADVSFASPLSFHTKINKGAVYVSDLFKLYKYENLLYTISLSGKEIDKYLEYSVSMWFNTMKNENDHLLKIKKNDNGKYILENKYFNLSSAGGIDYIIDVTKPDGYKVKILGFANGNRFYADSIYSVAVNSYRGNGGGGHLTEGVGLSRDEIKNRLINTTEYDIRFLIMKWIESKGTINPVNNNNWRVIPEDYFEQGKQKDMRLLFEIKE